MKTIYSLFEDAIARAGDVSLIRRIEASANIYTAAVDANRCVGPRPDAAIWTEIGTYTLSTDDSGRLTVVEVPLDSPNHRKQTAVHARVDSILGPSKHQHGTPDWIRNSDLIVDDAVAAAVEDFADVDVTVGTLDAIRDHMRKQASSDPAWAAMLGIRWVVGKLDNAARILAQSGAPDVQGVRELIRLLRQNVEGDIHRQISVEANEEGLL